jgi:hypothetical protein
MTAEPVAQPADLGDLARSIQWAELVVNAALPLDERRTLEGIPAAKAADRAALRAVAFAGVLRELFRYEYATRPGVLEALTEGRMPPVTGDPS